MNEELKRIAKEASDKIREHYKDKTLDEISSVGQNRYRNPKTEGIIDFRTGKRFKLVQKWDWEEINV